VVLAAAMHPVGYALCGTLQRINSHPVTTEANTSISELQFSSSKIYEELIWWGEGHSLAKQVLTALSGIESAVS